MDSEATRTPGSMRLIWDLSREAVNLALQGEWERATEVNKAILELFSDDVEAMNRLVKALIELGNYLDARAVLNQVCEVAPYNNIAKKNRARLDQLTADPEMANTGSSKQPRKSAGAPIFSSKTAGNPGPRSCGTPVETRRCSTYLPATAWPYPGTRTRLLCGRWMGSCWVTLSLKWAIGWRV